jgi:hypothetical protein
MAHTIDYILVTATSAGELAQQVTQKLNDGWQLYAQPIISGSVVPVYAQALVRDVTKPVKIGVV